MIPKDSRLAIGEALANHPERELEKFPVKATDIEDMTSFPVEPDLSDLESTSYYSSDYVEDPIVRNKEKETDD